MAIYHLSAKVFSRSSGASVVGKAAYRSGEDLYDRTIDKTFAYTNRKNDIAYKEIMTPHNAPDWVGDRQELWSQVEEKEKRKDAQLAREVVVALPVELSFEKNTELLKSFVQSNFVDKGMIADIAIHDIASHNPHAHVMLTMREVTAEGFGQKKRQWNSNETLVSWRENWELAVNESLADSGSNERVDHRTLAAQNINREPLIHLPVSTTHMERKGIKTILGDINRNIIQRNRAVKLLKASISKVAKSPMELWNLIKDSGQIQAIHPYLKPPEVEPAMAGSYQGRINDPPNKDKEPDIDR
jgi:ATP-dependent exoDNAse (exonuclease V) alpha subunit